VLGALVTAGLVLVGLLVVPAQADASSTSVTKIGAWSRDWSWFDANVGPVDVYRGYDGGFHYPTWQQVPRSLAHPGGMNDYSFQLPPADVASGADDGILKTFIASTPTNIVLTNFHEPEQEIEDGQFTFAQFRAANAHLHALVQQQNAIDGGTRKVSVILMVSTFTKFKNRNPENYWPTVAKGDGGTVDLVSADVYAAPHATGTAGVPIGYTDGVNWKDPAKLMMPVVKFAQAHATDWAVSELGYLEDVNNPMRKAQALQAAVAAAEAGKPSATAPTYRPALWISYWDSKGGRADWELRYNNPPVPSTSGTSNAAVAWKTLAAETPAPPPPPDPDPAPAPPGVSSTPEATPQIGGSRTSGTDGTIEQVRQIVQRGATMYAVGSFTQVRDTNSTTPVARGNGMAFSATSPHRLTAWNPRTDRQIDTVACAGDGSVLLGGNFRNAGGAANKNLARVDGTTGASLPFAYHPNGRVAHIEVVQGHALVGGYFAGYLSSVAPTTGVPDGYGLPVISGNYVFPGAKSNASRVWNMSVSPDQSAVLMTGVFTSVGGQHHEQIFRLNLTPGAATVSPWAPAELFTHCSTVQPFYAQDAAWSSDMTMIFTATTGYKPYNLSASVPRSGPCDAAIAYSAAEVANGAHLWINYAGCDSLYSVATDETTVYVGGHQRWMSNPNGCDRAGTGAIAQPGLGELNPADGTHQPGPNRGRGLGADDLLRTSAGLWVASDNQSNTAACAGKSNHMGICFLPDW
jgi:hypothetical protein